MKVIHYFDRFKPLIGGIETHIENLVKMPGYEHEVLTNAIPNLLQRETISETASVNRIRPNDRTILPFTNSSISKASFPYRVLTDISRNKRKFDRLKQDDYDILHVHGPAISMNLQRIDRWFEKPRLIKKLNFSMIDKPKILTMHGLFSPFTDNPFAEEYEKLLIGMFDNIICVDEFILDRLTSYGKNDAVLIHNSIDTDMFKYVPHKDHEKIKLGFVGRIDDDIGGISLMKELARMKLPWLEIFIAGAGTPRSTKALSSALDNKNVKFHPNLKPDMIPDFLSEIDILFNPVQTGAVTRVTLEAMACGRPVIMFGKDKHGPIENKRSGYLIKPDIGSLVELLNGLASDRKTLIEMGLNARKVIETCYSNDIIFPEMAKVYNDMMQN